MLFKKVYQLFRVLSSVAHLPRNKQSATINSLQNREGFPMKHRLLAILCALALLLGAVPAASALEGEKLRAADTLATLGLIQGSSEADYRLNEPATRAHAAALLVRLAGAQADARADIWIGGFRDLPAWAADDIDYAVHQGWMRGATPIDFHPNAQIDACDWFAALLRMIGYDDTTGDFSLDVAADFAQRIGLVSIHYEGLLRRGDLFDSMHEALVFPMKDGSGTVLDNLIRRGLVARSTANALGLLSPVLDARKAADRHMSAVFSLELYHTNRAAEAKQSDASGSGFFITEDGIAVTNYHCIERAVSGYAELITGESYPVEKVLFYDPGLDVAILKISKTSTMHRPTSQFAALKIAPSGLGDVRVGDTVYTLGSPLGLGLAVSSGIISDTDRIVSPYDIPLIMDTADISNGSSGGALLNVYGQVIGITTASYRYGNNMYLAVPIHAIQDVDLTVEGQTLKQVRDAMELTFD